MITFLLILSLYSAILSSFLFGKWVRLVIKRRQVRRKIKLEMASPEWKAFLEGHPPANPTLPTLSQVKKEEEEEEGEVIRGFEAEMDQAESEEVEESIEEKEWREEEMIRLKRGSRR